MKKIVYGVKEGSSSTCELISPNIDRTGFSSLINQSIIRNDVSEEAVGKSFYGIGFRKDYFVFSKTYIVYDNSKRVSHLSFILTLKNDESNLDLFDQIQNLEKDYDSKKLIEQNDLQEVIVNKESQEDKKPPVTIATLYNNDEELKNNFHCLDSYKNYRQIYFIKPEDKKKLENAIRYDHFFDNINEIKRQKENVLPKEKNEKLFSLKSIFRR
jgi:hypothetical protein